ncbi:hypothetical protein RhiirA1_404776 [Rhizophagus irregularis]|uniref:Uncharacterized protein n=1 Tax=Rhizophagus irregularis TaxID=588596 RepID=A0A2N0QNT8_9GLOM|nr:hypothetical protein RhiirA1_404776 [Rhizophagus irregularis]
MVYDGSGNDIRRLARKWKYCLTYGGSKCKNLCHTCLVDRNNLNKINLTTEEMLPRTQQNMQTAINSGLTKEHSIHEQNNAFWNLPYKLMKSWAKDFVLIGSYSNNQCQYPKLHHFLYYMISAIKDYGSPNGWNAETFEFLHKAYIKDPYCMSNKHNVNHQILGTVMRKLTLQEVYKTIFLNKPRHFYQSNEVILYKNYNNIPFRLIETTVNELKVREGPPEIIDGLEHFLEALSEYLKIMPDLNDEVENSMEKINMEAVQMIKVENGFDLKDSSQEFKNWAMEKNNFMLLDQKVISLAEQSKILQEYIMLNDDFTSRFRDENFLTDERKIGEK